MSAGSDNAAAAANMNSSLSGLRDFLYKYNVQKPLIDEQTAQAKQQTAAGQIALNQQQNKVAVNAAASAFHNGAAFGKPNSPLPGTTSAGSASTQIPSGDPGSATFNSPNPDTSAGAPGPTAGTASTPAPAPAQTDTTPAAPGSPGYVTPLPPDTSGNNIQDEPPAPLIKMRMPAVAPSVTPSVLPPGVPSGNSVDPLEQYRGQLWSSVPPAAQSELAKGYLASVPHPEALSMEDMVDAHNSAALAAMQVPITAATAGSMGLQRIGYSDKEGSTYAPAGNGANGSGRVNPETDANGNPTGFVLVDGKPQADPLLVAPEKMAGYMGDITNLQNQQVALNKVKDIIANHPEYLGKSGADMAHFKGGTILGKAGGYGRSFLGDPAQETANTSLSQKAIGGILDTLSQIHIGRVTEKEWNGITGLTPTQDKPVASWQTWVDATQNALNGKREGVESILGPRGYLGPDWKPSNTYQPMFDKGGAETPSTSLPKVTPATKVSPIAPSTTGVGDGTVSGSNAGADQTQNVQTLNTADAVNGLKSGQTYIWGPNGKKYTKN